MKLIYIILILVSVIGGISDWKTRKIPNWLTFGTFFLALIYNICLLKFEPVLSCILGFFVGLLLLIIPYILGGMGAGDVKLLAAIGSIVGYKNILVIFFFTAISGLVLGLVWLIGRPGHLKFLISTGQVLNVADKKEKIPYGIAIMFGVIIFVYFTYSNSMPSFLDNSFR